MGPEPEEEDYEEAAVLKRRIKVLEETLGQSVKYESRKVDPVQQQHSRAERERPKALSQTLGYGKIMEDLSGISVEEAMKN
eukprot:s912_g23.t1